MIIGYQGAGIRYAIFRCQNIDIDDSLVGQLTSHMAEVKVDELMGLHLRESTNYVFVICVFVYLCQISGLIDDWPIVIRLGIFVYL